MPDHKGEGTTTFQAVGNCKPDGTARTYQQDRILIDSAEGLSATEERPQAGRAKAAPNVPYRTC